MKRFLYSGYTKTIALFLFILSICISLFFCGNCIAELRNDDEIIYNFENSFTESRHLSDLLCNPEIVIGECYIDYYSNDHNADSLKSDTKQSVAEYIASQLESPRYADGNVSHYPIDKIDYILTVDGETISNCGVQSAEELINIGDYQGAFYRYNERKTNGDIVFKAQPNDSYYYYDFSELSDYNPKAEITLCAKVKDDYVRECEELWAMQFNIVHDAMVTVLFYLLVAILFLIYLLAVTGKTAEKETLSYPIDRLWTEIHLACLGIVSIGAVALVIAAIDSFLSNQIPFYLMQAILFCVSALGSLLLLISLLSLVRKVKNRSFLKTSIIYKILHWLWKQLIRLKGISLRALSQKSGRYLLAAILLYTALLLIFFIMTLETGFFGIFLCILLFGIAVYLLAHRAKDLDSIRSGVKSIRNGDLQYKITDLHSEDLKPLAQDINDIADGLEHSMEEKLKAERMKSDLITNVSHDLKTPLTSIINYTTLLCTMEDLPEEARDYIAIIAKKSDGLKNLTRDLFDISKVQSGNEAFENEELDAAQLIEQTMAEHHGEIEASSFTFCVNAEKDLIFTADGRKMSRVWGNLIENALKYAMSGTRIFLEAKEEDRQIKMEIKNISAVPMDFDAEEITARFVRGDSSRTDGGNGLGLAIAKSYVEGCGGSFEITLDGDLFKATMHFPRS